MKLKKLKFATVLGLGFTLLGCNAGKNKTNIEVIQNMMDQISIKAQDWNPNNPEIPTGLVPPKGTVPIGFDPYPFVGDPIGAEQNLKNPMMGDFSPELIDLGRDRYEIYCKVCHGPTGNGDGSVAPAMILKPPSLNTDKVKAFRDGRIFHIITDGQGVMGSYWSQIRSEKERWAVVNYVRSLQKRADAK